MAFGVRFEGVSKRYRTGGDVVHALRDVTLSIDPGAAVAVQGPSGSGKSTLLHVAGSMDRPDEGTVTVGEFEVTALSPSEEPGYRRRIGFVFQRFHLIPALTALDNVMAPVVPYRTPFDRVDRARELLAATGLAGRERAYPSELSGGEQQRVAIARALINEPGLVLADEPTGNLDERTTGDILQLLLDIRRERGMTLVIATHDPVAAARCERIVVLRDGAVSDDVRIAEDEIDEGQVERWLGLNLRE